MPLRYIDPQAPLIKPPQYPGEYCEALVPATLDLAERCALAVNGLTETTDPECDHELYWIVDLLARQPAMYHTVDDHVQDKFFQALPLVRTACGSRQNLDVEHCLLQTYLRKQGPDGLIYIPIPGRPWALPAQPNPWAGLDELPRGDHWCSVAMTGRVLGALCIYALKDPAGPFGHAAHRLVRGLERLVIPEGDMGYLAANSTTPGAPAVRPAARPVGLRAAIGGWVAQGLAQCHRSLGDETAAALAQRLMRYIMRDSGYFQADGEFAEDFPGAAHRTIHFHAHTCQIMAALEVVQATGDELLLELAVRAYEYALSQGEPTLGFFPEWLNYRGGGYGVGPNSSEICEVADMIACAIKLSLLGHDRWDDVDRWTRNQFSESQLTSTHWLTDGHLAAVDRDLEPLPGAGCAAPEFGTVERVPQRAVGSFSGWPSASDFVQGRGWSIMHCCTGNGARALYYVWESILSYSAGTLRINLLLNRASPWADVDSHIPCAGRVEVSVKQDLALELRLAEWVQPDQARCRVGGDPRPLTFRGRYARAGRVRAGDRVVFEFPISESTHAVVVEKHSYTVTRRGNEVVHIDPAGRNLPLYQRAHWRSGETLWRKTTRFVPADVIRWS